MKVLLVNKFLFPKGGAEAVLFDQIELLRSRGHSIAVLAMDHPRNIPCPWPAAFVSRVEMDGPDSVRGRIRAAGRLLYSFEARRRLAELIRRERPDVAHLHNIHHQISPSILHTLKRHGVPTVMTLHDLKLACPVYTGLSRGRLCDRCRNERFYRCAVRRCSKGSLAKSTLAAAEMYLHRVLLRIERHVDLFLTPSRFLKDKLEEMGVGVRLEHLPHFLDAAEYVPDLRPRRPSFVYFGRLDRTKGLLTLVRAAAGGPCPGTIIGEGDLRPELERAVRGSGPEGIALRPFLGREDLAAAVREASFAVLPSEWPENSPRMVLESFALGKPVLGARTGGIPELVRDGVTGFLFEPGNADDLRRKMTILAEDPDRTAAMGRRARKFVEEELDPESHYRRLMSVYDRARKDRP